MTGISTGQNPVLTDFRSRLQGNPALKASLEQQVKIRQPEGGASPLNANQYSHLQTEFLKQLGVADPAKATPEQLQAVQTLLTDALDGHLDGQVQNTESEALISQLAQTARENSSFNPVGAQVEFPPKTATQTVTPAVTASAADSAPQKARHGISIGQKDQPRPAGTITTEDRPLLLQGKPVTAQQFAGLSTAQQFEILLEADANQLKPLLQSLTKAQRQELRARAVRLLEGYNEAITKLPPPTGPVGVAPSVSSALPNTHAPRPVEYNTGEDKYRERARLIIKLIDEIDDQAGSPTPQNPVTVPASPPAVVSPPPAAEKPTPPPSVTPPVAEAPAPVAPVAPPEPAPPDFSTQHYLERMQRYAQDKDLDHLLKDLNPEDQVKLVRLLDETVDGDFRLPAGSSQRLAVPTREQARQTLESLQPRLQQLPTSARGEITAQLLAKGTRPDLAFGLLQQAHQQGDLPTLISHLRKDGQNLSAEIPRQLPAAEAGKVLAWMLADQGPEQRNATEIGQHVRELSRYWTQDDNITRAMVKELQQLTAQPGAETRGLAVIKERLGQDLVRKLSENLSQGWVTAEDRDFLLKLSAAAGTQHHNQQLQQLLKRGDHRQALELLNRSNDQDLAALLSSSDLAGLQRTLSSNPTAFATLLERLERGASQRAPGDQAALQARLTPLIEGLPLERLRQSWRALSDDGKLELGERTREALLSRFASSGDFEATQTLLRGGLGLPPATGDSRSRMLDTLSAQITRTRDVKQAGAALTWILEAGNRTQIERAFNQVSRDSRWGPRKGEIVGEAMTQGRELLRGKLSLDTLQQMAGALNNFSAKLGTKSPAFVRDALGMGDFNRNVAHIRTLAELGNRDARGAIMRDLMDYWTPAQSETLIHDVLRDTGRQPGELKALLESLGTRDRSGAQRLSDELEDRGELGRIMATVVENYGPGADQVLNEIMGRWNSGSLKADDFIHTMLKTLEPDAAKKLAARLSPDTLRTLSDWTDDAFRDGNLRQLDSESQWSLQVLEAALRLKGRG
jgi:hypothetical protein